MAVSAVYLSLLLCILISVASLALGLPSTIGSIVGRRLRRSSQVRRQLLLDNAAREQREHDEATHKNRGGERVEKEQDDNDWERIEHATVGTANNGSPAGSDWRGIVAFFHPFCNAGGGGERVLWEAIRATQQRWPGALCVVYTGDHDTNKAQMLQRVRDRFNIHLHAPQVNFLYLTRRHLVLASSWPRFTLLGQSIGSMLLAWEAFTLLVPDIFIDTMGYAFAVFLSSLLFPAVPTGAYVHYPTISTDMLDSLSTSAGGQGIHTGAGHGYRGHAKRVYWELFAKLYSKIGAHIDVVMTNSTWTQSHIKALWGPHRSQRRRTSTSSHDIDVVFPPVAVSEVEAAIPLPSTPDHDNRKPHILYIAQFRPEKNHELILRAFAAFVRLKPRLPAYENEKPKLILIGSVREADETRIYQLRLLARELHINDAVEFRLDAKWPAMLECMGAASVGVNGMWSEHFGIGVVEYQAAGLISVVNDSGGPKLDIVVDMEGQPTGFHASTMEEYTEAFAKALSLSPAETLAMRKRARRSAQRFTDRAFDDKWIQNMHQLVGLQVARAGKTTKSAKKES